MTLRVFVLSAFLWALPGCAFFGPGGVPVRFVRPGLYPWTRGLELRRYDLRGFPAADESDPFNEGHLTSPGNLVQFIRDNIGPGTWSKGASCSEKDGFLYLEQIPAVHDAARRFLDRLQHFLRNRKALGMAGIPVFEVDEIPPTRYTDKGMEVALARIPEHAPWRDLPVTLAFYDVSALCAGRREYAGEDISLMIRDMVRPGRWGPGTSVAFRDGFMIVWQQTDVHESIRRVLGRFHEFLCREGGPKGRVEAWEFPGMWDDLAQDDADRASMAWFKFCLAGEAGVEFLRDRVARETKNPERRWRAESVPGVYVYDLENAPGG